MSSSEESVGWKQRMLNKLKVKIVTFWGLINWLFGWTSNVAWFMSHCMVYIVMKMNRCHQLFAGKNKKICDYLHYVFTIYFFYRVIWILRAFDNYYIGSLRPELKKQTQILINNQQNAFANYMAHVDSLVDRIRYDKVKQVETFVSISSIIYKNSDEIKAFADQIGLFLIESVSQGNVLAQKFKGFKQSIQSTTTLTSNINVVQAVVDVNEANVSELANKFITEGKYLCFVEAKKAARKMLQAQIQNAPTPSMISSSFSAPSHFEQIPQTVAAVTDADINKLANEYIQKGTYLCFVEAKKAARTFLSNSNAFQPSSQAQMTSELQNMYTSFSSVNNASLSEQIMQAFEKLVLEDPEKFHQLSLTEKARFLQARIPSQKQIIDKPLQLCQKIKDQIDAQNIKDSLTDRWLYDHFFIDEDPASFNRTCLQFSKNFEKFFKGLEQAPNALWYEEMYKYQQQSEKLIGALTLPTLGEVAIPLVEVQAVYSLHQPFQVGIIYADMLMMLLLMFVPIVIYKILYQKR